MAVPVTFPVDMQIADLWQSEQRTSWFVVSGCNALICAIVRGSSNVNLLTDEFPRPWGCWAAKLPAATPTEMIPAIINFFIFPPYAPVNVLPNNGAKEAVKVGALFTMVSMYVLIVA